MTTNHSDIYSEMLEVAFGIKDLQGNITGIRGYSKITKKAAKEAGVAWSFVENSAKILGLTIAPHGRYGYCVSK